MQELLQEWVTWYPKWFERVLTNVQWATLPETVRRSRSRPAGTVGK